MKLPAYQFYPGDWMKDPALRSVSLASRGLWIDMLCLMFESSRRGYLQQANGQPLSLTQLARMTGCATDEAAHLVQELEDAGVCSRTEHGTIYSRRLVRDEQKRESDRTRMNRYREKGGGDPANWTAIRVTILKRDGECCGYCGKFANTVDHVIPKTRGGTEDSWNLIACCKACNNRKNNRTPREAEMSFWREFNLTVLNGHPHHSEFVFETPLITRVVTDAKQPSSTSTAYSKLNTAPARFEPGIQKAKNDYDPASALEFWKRKKDRGDADYKDAPNWVRKELDK